MPPQGPPESFADVEALLIKGVDLFLRGHTKAAANAFHEALALDPTNAQAREYLRTILGNATLDARAVPEVRTAWDAGPSLGDTITLEDDVQEQRFDAAHSDPNLPRPEVPEDARYQSKLLLQEAKAAAARGDFTGAVEYCDRLISLDPGSSEGRELREESANTLVGMYESQLGGRHGIPEIVAGHEDIIWLGLDNRAGFVLAQIDGQVSYDDLYAICGMSRLDTSRILAQLVGQKVIRTRPPAQGGRTG
jgi:tetratricopeptide (TPR) repeat protein